MFEIFQRRGFDLHEIETTESSNSNKDSKDNEGAHPTKQPKMNSFDVKKLRTQPPPKGHPDGRMASAAKAAVPCRGNYAGTPRRRAQVGMEKVIPRRPLKEVLDCTLLTPTEKDAGGRRWTRQDESYGHILHTGCPQALGMGQQKYTKPHCLGAEETEFDYS
jgi:hypothetical protein